MTATAGRLPLAVLCDRYGLEASPSFAGGTTITSMTAMPARACPGCLFVCGADMDRARLATVSDAGAYALLAPASAREGIEALGPEIPVAYADDVTTAAAGIAADLNGQPSHQLAVFTLFGPAASRAAKSLSGLLHVLGYPVGLVDADGSFSQERPLRMPCPLDAMELNRVLAVFVEDGVSAAVICAQEGTLAPAALAGVSIDVAALAGDDDASGADMSAWAHPLGAVLGPDCRVVAASADSDELAATMLEPGAARESLSLAIAMVMQVGIRKGSIRGALKVTKEFRND